MKKTLFSILVFMLSFSVVHADVPDTFTVDANDMYFPSDKAAIVAEYPIDSEDVIFRFKKNAEGKVIYCMEHDYYMIESGTWTFKYSDVASKKVMGAMSNGYPNVRLTGDEYKDYFITSMAIWYVAGTSGNMFDGIDLDNGTYKGEENAIVKEIAKLVQKANSYSFATPSIRVSNSNHNLALSTDKKYYVSDALGVALTGKIDNFVIDLVNAPKGTIIVDAAGEERHVFGTSDRFYVKVPAENVTADMQFDISISAEATVENAYFYVPDPTKAENGRDIQSVSVVYSDTVDVDSSFTLGLKVVVPDNPKTGTILGVISCIVGIAAIGLSLNYFARLNKAKQEN